MVRLSDISEGERDMLLELECQTYDEMAWVEPKPLRERRIAMVSTAGLHRRDDRPFVGVTGEYRVIPGDTEAGDLVMSHVSTSYDRIGFQQDLNVILPVDRLRELAEEGTIGSVADYHYAFVGAASPDELEPAARQIAGLLKKDNVDTVVLIPV
jgi:D-proline reductase (dithiol) PrdB